MLIHNSMSANEVKPIHLKFVSFGTKNSFCEGEMHKRMIICEAVFLHSFLYATVHRENT